MTAIGQCIKKTCGKLDPKHAPSTLTWRVLGRYTSSHRGQKFLKRDVRNQSLSPTGSTFCRSQSALGQVPYVPLRNFWYTLAKPRGECIKRACIKLYKSDDSWLSSRKVSSFKSSSFGYWLDKIIRRQVFILSFVNFSWSPCKLNGSRINSSSISTRNS